MVATSKEEQYSLEKAMTKLAEIFLKISEDGRSYYLKSATEVDAALLNTFDLSFAGLSILSQEFIDQWLGSRIKGPDAIQSSDQLKERIDIKLFETGKLDFDQMKKIMLE